MNDLHSLVLAVCAFFGLNPPGVAVYQGYGEGDYVLASPQVAGRIETLDVARGQQIHKGDTLFTLEHAAEQEAVNQAKAAADKARATLADLLKAKRQPELDQLVAARDEAAAALQIARLNVERDEKQIKTQAISQAAYDNDKA